MFTYRDRLQKKKKKKKCYFFLHYVQMSVCPYILSIGLFWINYPFHAFFYLNAKFKFIFYFNFTINI